MEETLIKVCAVLIAFGGTYLIFLGFMCCRWMMEDMEADTLPKKLLAVFAASTLLIWCAGIGAALLIAPYRLFFGD